MVHADDELPTLRKDTIYMTMIFLRENRPNNLRNDVMYGDCIIFHAELVQQLHQTFSNKIKEDRDLPMKWYVYV